MIDVTSHAAGAATAIHAVTGLNISETQIVATAAAVRYIHLEAPVIGRSIYRAGQWVEAQGGFRGIVRRLLGPGPFFPAKMPPLPDPSTVCNAPAPTVPLHQNLGQ